MIEDFKKLKYVLTHPQNEKTHTSSLREYIRLFLRKWDHKSPLEVVEIKEFMVKYYTYYYED
jgi:hypothetical protein